MRRLRQQLFPSNIRERDAQPRAARWAQQILIFLFIGGPAAVVLLNTGNIGSAWDRHRAKQIERELTPLIESLADGSSPAAIHRIKELNREALALIGEHPPILIPIGNFQLTIRSPYSFLTWKQIQQKGLVPDEEAKLGLIESYIWAKDFSEARKLLDTKFTNEQSSLKECELRLLLAEVETPINHLEVLRCLLAIDKLTGLTPTQSLQKHAIIATNPNFPTRERSRSIRVLLSLTNRQDELGLKALNVLCLHQPQPWNFGDLQGQLLAQRLEEHPLGEEAHKIRAIELFPELYRGHQEDLILKAMDERKDIASANLLPFARWLNSNQRYEETLALLKGRPNKELGPAISAKCDALLGIKKNAELEHLIYTEDYWLDRASQYLFRAQYERGVSGDLKEAADSLLEAIEAARIAGMPEKLLNLSSYALENGMAEVAEKGYRFARAFPPFKQQATLGLTSVASKRNDDEQVLVHLKELPSATIDASYSFTIAYLESVSGENVEIHHAKAIEALAADPSDTRWRLILALCLHHYSAYEELQLEIQSITPKKQELASNHKLVFHKLSHFAGLEPAAPSDAPNVPLYKGEKRFLQAQK